MRMLAASCRHTPQLIHRVWDGYGEGMARGRTGTARSPAGARALRGSGSASTPGFAERLNDAARAHAVSALFGVHDDFDDLGRFCTREPRLSRALDEAVIEAARAGMRAADIRDGLVTALTPLVRQPFPTCEGGIRAEDEEMSLGPVCRIAHGLDGPVSRTDTRRASLCPLFVRVLTGELGAVLRSWRAEPFGGARYEQEAFSPHRAGRPFREHIAFRGSIRSREDIHRAIRAWSRICPDPDPVAGERLTLFASPDHVGHIARLGAPTAPATLQVAADMDDTPPLCVFVVERRLVIDGRPLHVRVAAATPIIGRDNTPTAAAQAVADRIGLSWDGQVGPASEDDLTTPELRALPDAQARAADEGWERTTLETLIGPEAPCTHSSERWTTSEVGTAAVLGCRRCGRERVGAVRRDRIPVAALPLALTPGERERSEAFLAAVQAETGCTATLPQWQPGCLRPRYWRTPPTAAALSPRAHRRSTEAQLLARRR